MSILRYVGVLGLVLALCGRQTGSASAAGPTEGVSRIDLDVNPRTKVAIADDPDGFHFAIVADRTGGLRPGVFGDAVRKLNLLRPVFVMCVGDLIEGYTEDEAELDRQWEELEGMVRRLRMPFFHVPGNHDISNQVMARKWEERFGRPYYDFLYRNVLFLCLNTEDAGPGRLSDEQLRYVAAALERTPEPRWTLVFMHKPLWRDEEMREDANTGWKEVEALLQDRPYTVFAGHNHTYTRYLRGGRRYFRLATTGGGSNLAGPAFGKFDHLVWVTMSDDGPQLANLMLDGIHDEDVVTEEGVLLLPELATRSAVRPGLMFTQQEVFEGAVNRVELVNNTEFPVKVRVAFAPHDQVRPDPQAVERVLEPNSTATVEVRLGVEKPVKVAELAPLALDWTMTHELPDRPAFERKGSQRIGIEQLQDCPRRRAPVVVDGRLDEWPDLPVVCRKPAELRLDREAWTGLDDCSFRFAVAYDDEYLYLAIETTDDTCVVQPDMEPWQQDAIEVRLDARPAPTRSYHRGGGEFEEFLFLAASPGRTVEEVGWFQQDRIPEGVQAVCVRTEKGHNTEIAVPVRYLNEKQGESWKGFRLNIAVDDFDAPEGPGSQIWWRPDWRRALNYPGSGTFRRR